VTCIIVGQNKCAYCPVQKVEGRRPEGFLIRAIKDLLPGKNNRDLSFSTIFNKIGQSATQEPAILAGQ